MPTKETDEAAIAAFVEFSGLSIHEIPAPIVGYAWSIPVVMFKEGDRCVAFCLRSGELHCAILKKHSDEIAEHYSILPTDNDKFPVQEFIMDRLDWLYEEKPECV